MTQRFRRAFRISLAAALAGLVALVAVHDVPTGPTAEDARYARLILDEAGYRDVKQVQHSHDFEGEVRVILAVQDAVLRVAGEDRAIPFGRPREPKDLYEVKHGLCFDRSRAIEKILTWLGFETRHVAVYATKATSVIAALTTRQSPSHAVSEVLTRKGWMVVDSNRRWIALDESRNVVSLADLRNGAAAEKGWAADSRARIDTIFTGPFVAIRGLYSRHGNFYPPYTPLPDYNLRQLLSNASD